MSNTTCDNNNFNFSEVEDTVAFNEYRKINPKGNPEPKQMTLTFYSSRNNYVIGSSNGNYIGKYIILGKLGNGAFGEVRLGVHILTRLHVAIKILNKSKFDAKSEPKILREIKILKTIVHPNIVKLYEVMETGTHIYLVMENCSGGELFNHLINGRVTEKFARSLIRPIISAVKYCHHNNIVHRDLKAENILLDSRLEVKIVDFGFGNEFTRGSKLNTFCGSPPYAAPELFTGRKYEGPEVDIWAIGVLIYCLVTGGFPFDAQQMSDLKEKVCRGRYRVPYYMSTDLEKLLQRMLCVSLSKRATINEVSANKWVSEGFENSPIELLDNQNPIGNIDNEIFDIIIAIGYNRSSVVDSLKYHYFDEIMSLYLMLKDIKDGKVLINIPYHIKSIKNPLDRWIKIQYILKEKQLDTKQLIAGADSTSEGHESNYNETSTANDINNDNLKVAKDPNKLGNSDLTENCQWLLEDNEAARKRSQTVEQKRTNFTTTGSRDRSKTVAEHDKKRNRLFSLFPKFTIRNTPKSRSNTQDDEEIHNVPNNKDPTSGVESNNDAHESLNSNDGPQPRRVYFSWTCKILLKLNPIDILTRIKDVLALENIDFTEKRPFILTCSTTIRPILGYTSSNIVWEIEVVRFNKTTHGIHVKRVYGPSFEYKNIVAHIFQKLNI